MQGFKVFNLNPYKNSRWSFSVLLLLALYLSVFVKSSAVLPHTHTHHEESSTAEENNPCHIALYHPGKEGGCHHKSHISQNEKECSLSHVTFVRQTTPPEIEIPVFFSSVFFAEYFYEERSSSHREFSTSTRGPPAL